MLPSVFLDMVTVTHTLSLPHTHHQTPLLGIHFHPNIFRSPSHNSSGYPWQSDRELHHLKESLGKTWHKEVQAGKSEEGDVQ